MTAFLVILFLPIFAAPAHAFQGVLILYDSSARTGIRHLAHEKTLASLMGHFSLSFTRKSVDQYQAGDIANSRATFYIGNVADKKLPDVFLEEALNSKRPFVWINFNLAQLALSKKYQSEFESRFGIRYKGPLFNNNAYENVLFRNRTFQRQQRRIGRTKVIDDSKATVMGLAITPNRKKFFPYIVRSDNFTYVADNPMEVWFEDQAYIVFAETLHTVLGIAHTESHQALVRLENINAEDDPVKLRALADYLSGSGVPFSFIVVPRFTDPLGATGPARSANISNVPPIVSALKYMQSKGGTMLMHGYTHQFDLLENPFSGATPQDVEFFISRFFGGSIIPISPLPGDSGSQVQGRLDNGFTLIRRAGLSKPRIWVTPNYQASQKDYRAFSNNFAALNERSPEAYYPYLINKDVNGNKIIPENLGFIQPGSVSPGKIVELARKNQVVRDGFASFFFHPGFDIDLLDQAVIGIKNQGYTFVDIDKFL